MPKKPSFSPIIIDNFFTSHDLKSFLDHSIMAERSALPGSMRSTYDNPIFEPAVKNNRVSVVSPHFMAKFSGMIKKKIDKKLKENLIILPHHYQLGFPQFSFYKDGSYYGSHTDRTEFGLTMIILLSEKKFDGGSLLIKSKKKISIPYKQNRAIIFPSACVHEVINVRGVGTRISLQFFFTSQNNVQESNKMITQNRKELAKNILKLDQKKEMELKQLVELKEQILDFKNKSFPGAYRYIYFSIFHKHPSQFKTNLIHSPHFEMKASNHKLMYRIFIENKKLICEIRFSGKYFYIPFHYLSSQLVKQLKLE